ncbi:hypothetical protein Q3V40_16150, partial [Listeria monocytogenes]
QHDGFAAGRATIDFLALETHGFGVGATAGIAALTTLTLRQNRIDFFNNRIIFNRESAGGITQNGAEHQTQKGQGANGNP